MSNEGETSNIKTLILIIYVFIAFYSYLCHWISGDPLWTIPVYYLMSMTAFYIWHWMAHQKCTGRMNDEHMEHHRVKFPASDFYGDEK